MKCLTSLADVAEGLTYNAVKLVIWQLFYFMSPAFADILIVHYQRHIHYVDQVLLRNCTETLTVICT